MRKIFENELENEFMKYLDDCYENVKILGYAYGTGHSLKTIDYIAFRQAFLDWSDNKINNKELIPHDRGNYYTKSIYRSEVK